MYNAETFRTALLDAQKQTVAFQQRFFDWQLGQAEAAEGQLKAQVELGRKMMASTVELTKANQKAWLDSLSTAKA